MGTSNQALLAAATLSLEGQKGVRRQEESERRKLVEKRQTIQNPQRVQLGTQEKVLKHYSGNTLKCRLLVQRHQAKHKVPGFCFYKLWGLQTPA